jgi:preprotein translocase subunit YajC
VSTISLTGDEVTLKIDDNAKIRVLKSSIVRIVSKDAPKDAATPNA